MSLCKKIFFFLFVFIFFSDLSISSENNPNRAAKKRHADSEKQTAAAAAAEVTADDDDTSTTASANDDDSAKKQAAARAARPQKKVKTESQKSKDKKKRSKKSTDPRRKARGAAAEASTTGTGDDDDAVVPPDDAPNASVKAAGTATHIRPPVSAAAADNATVKKHTAAAAAAAAAAASTTDAVVVDDDTPPDAPPPIRAAPDSAQKEKKEKHAAAAALGLPIKITFFNVGQGNSTLVRCPNGGALLIDGGSKKIPEAAMKTIDPAASTKEQAVAKSEIKEGMATTIAAKIEAAVPTTSDPIYIIITHGDGDHYNLIKSIVELLRGRGKTVHVFFGGKSTDYNADFRRKILDDFGDPAQALKEEIEAGTDICPGTNNVKVLWDKIQSDKNDSSIMIKIIYGNHSAIIGGDNEGFSTQQVQKEAKMKSSSACTHTQNAEPDYLCTNILLAHHHGAHTHGSNSPDWVKATSPEYVVFSSAKKYGHASCKIVQRIRRQAPRLQTVGAHSLTCGIPAGEHKKKSEADATGKKADATGKKADATGKKADAAMSGFPANCTPDSGKPSKSHLYCTIHDERLAMFNTHNSDKGYRFEWRPHSEIEVYEEQDEKAGAVPLNVATVRRHHRATTTHHASAAASAQ